MTVVEHFTTHARTGRAALQVDALTDELLEQHGYSARSDYVEMFWLPVLGPSSIWALRRLAALTADRDAVIEVSEFAAALGLGTGTGTTSPVVRTIDRLVRFDAAQWCGDCLLVRRMLGPVPVRQLVRLPVGLQRRHDEMVRRSGSDALAGVA